MREESQLDDMRDAIRGDFERLAARRGEQELMRLNDPEPPAEPTDPPLPAEELEEQPDEPDLASATPRRSWLGRMLST
ncbi:MAG TPA: hypothetical protein VFT33_02205 [Gaiellaceae bacterium]|nr:hypothetical protein [Gaiellaceae bacterium]